MTAVPVAQQHMTADEFLAQPLGEGPRWQELVEGEVVVNEPTARHNLAQGNLFAALHTWTRIRAGRGQVFIPLDVRLDDLNVFAPDISWYSASNPVESDAQPPYPRPDLAIEVRSPSTWRYDVGAKKGAYERHGLPELWLVDTPAQGVLVFRRSEPGAREFDLALELARGDALASPLLPDFSLALTELFETG